MKTIFRLGFFIFIISLYLFPSGGLNADSGLIPDTPEKTVSMDFQDVGLKDILKAFSIQSGLNFIASEAVQDRKITLYLDKVPLDKAMDKLFKANNLSYDLDREANIFMVKDWGKLQVETITRVFYLKYASVSSSPLEKEKASNFEAGTSSTGATTNSSTPSSTAQSNSSSASGSTATGGSSGITQAVGKLLSSNGSVIEDFRTNSLIVTDTPNHMQVIAQVIASLDVSVPQVMLEVEMLDVSKNTVDKIGLKFGQTPFSATFIGPTRFTRFPLSPWLDEGANLGKVGTNIPGHFSSGSLAIDSAGYTVLLDFLKTQTDTKYLARPRILTLNNQTAEIKITTQETVGVTTSTTTTEGTAQTQQGQPERVETGVSLRVTPQVNLDTGEITMFIMPTVKDTSTSTFLTQGSSSQFFKDPEERSTKSVVRIKDGETVIIGGLIRNENVETITKLPILGDIPLLGAFFRHKDKSKGRERELLIFITPHIIKDRDIKLVQAKKPAPASPERFPEREQNTVSGANREASISASLNRFDKKRN
jgi:type IV pilus secretin PilQ/predicted competence protein